MSNVYYKKSLESMVEQLNTILAERQISLNAATQQRDEFVKIQETISAQLIVLTHKIAQLNSDIVNLNENIKYISTQISNIKD